MDFTIHDVDYIFMRHLHRAGHASVVAVVKNAEMNAPSTSCDGNDRRKWLMRLVVGCVREVLPPFLEGIGIDLRYIDMCRTATDPASVWTATQEVIQEEAAMMSASWEPGWAAMTAIDSGERADVVMYIVRRLDAAAWECCALEQIDDPQWRLAHQRNAADMLGKALAAVIDEQTTDAVAKVIAEAYARQGEYVSEYDDPWG